MPPSVTLGSAASIPLHRGLAIRAVAALRSEGRKGPPQMTTTKADKVRAILARRYPCQAIPYGAGASIAAEVGLSRERVRQIANAAGLRHLPREAQSRGPCKGCGQPIPPGRQASAYCSNECGYLWLGVGQRGAAFIDESDFRDRECMCPLCEASFIWTSRQQYRRAKHVAAGIVEATTPATCSKRCAVAYARDPLTRDVERTCPGCGTAFIWTRRQQQQRASNARRGDVTADAPACCSRACARRMRETRRREVS